MQIIPSFLVDKGFFLPLRLSCKESSTFLTKPLFPQEREDVTALRCSEPLRYKVGGPSKVFAKLCGMGPHGLLWGSACNYIVESECMEGAYRLRPPFLFLIAVSLCACRRSNEEYSGCDSIGLWDDHMTNVQARFTTKSIKIFVSIKTLIMHIFYQPTHLSYFHLPVSACHLLPLMF